MAWKSALANQKELEHLLKSVKKAKILQLIGILMLVTGVILSAYLLQLAPNVRRTIPTSEEQINMIAAFLYSIGCAWFGLVLFAYSFYKHKKLSKQLKRKGWEPKFL